MSLSRPKNVVEEEEGGAVVAVEVEGDHDPVQLQLIGKGAWSDEADCKSVALVLPSSLFYLHMQPT